MIRTKVKCEKCGLEVSKSNYSRHISRHELHPESFKEVLHSSHDGSQCQFCLREFSTVKGRISHESFCKMNPSRKKTAYELHGNLFTRNMDTPRTAWNKGLTKETDDRLRARGEKLHERYQSGELSGSFVGKSHSEETKQHLRELAIQRGLGGHPYRGHIEYNGVMLDSSLELELAKRLDAMDIRWERCGKFTYTDPDGVVHTYTPDFYLPEYDVYLDPKNDYLIENINPALGFKDVDKISWVSQQNNVRIVVLSEKDIYNIDVEKDKPL